MDHIRISALLTKIKSLKVVLFQKSVVNIEDFSNQRRVLFIENVPPEGSVVDLLLQLWEGLEFLYEVDPRKDHDLGGLEHPGFVLSQALFKHLDLPEIGPLDIGLEHLVLFGIEPNPSLEDKVYKLGVLLFSIENVSLFVLPELQVRGDPNQEIDVHFHEYPDPVNQLLVQMISYFEGEIERDVSEEVDVLQVAPPSLLDLLQVDGNLLQELACQ